MFSLIYSTKRLITGSLAHCYLYYFFALFTLYLQPFDDCVLGYHEELLTALGAFIPSHILLRPTKVFALCHIPRTRGHIILAIKRFDGGWLGVEGGWGGEFVNYLNIISG